MIGNIRRMIGNNQLMINKMLMLWSNADFLCLNLQSEPFDLFGSYVAKLLAIILCFFLSLLLLIFKSDLLMWFLEFSYLLAYFIHLVLGIILFLFFSSL